MEREVDSTSDAEITPYASYKTMSTSTIRTRMGYLQESDMGL